MAKTAAKWRTEPACEPELMLSSTFQFDTYQYQPLESDNSIRLLVIHPGTEEPLKCHLEHHKLQHLPDFEALSYVWGNSEYICPIICEDQSIQLTKSLYNFLVRIRLSEQARIVWADGICINQQDINERGRQVKLMGDIYSTARRVVVWSGVDPLGAAPQAFEASKRIATLVATCIRGTNKSLGLVRYREIRWEPDTHESVLSIMQGNAETLKELNQCTWFTRLWILQEICLARSATVIWGQAEMDWDSMYALGHAYARFRPLGLVNFLDNIETLHAFKYRIYDGLPFIMALYLSTGIACTDERDRVYGLLGLKFASNNDFLVAKSIEPNYLASSQTLCVHVTAQAIAHGMLADVIECIDHKDELCVWTPGTWPSWAPRWTQENGCGMGPTSKKYPQLPSIFLDSKGIKRVTIEPKVLDNVTLAISSIVMDSAAGVTMAQESLRPHSAIWELISFWSSARQHGISNVGQKMHAALINNHYLNLPDCTYAGFVNFCQTAAQKTKFRDETQQQAYQDMLDLLVADLDNTNTEAEVRRPLKENDLGWIFRFQTLLLTNSGLVGLVPRGSRAQDVIVFLDQALYPVVVRPQGLFYRLIGVCDFPGLRDLSPETLSDRYGNRAMNVIEIR
jgi:hypothetical protein